MIKTFIPIIQRSSDVLLHVLVLACKGFFSERLAAKTELGVFNLNAVMLDNYITRWLRWVNVGLDYKPIKIVFCIEKMLSPLIPGTIQQCTMGSEQKYYYMSDH
jgi:hypothetical protein